MLLYVSTITLRVLFTILNFNLFKCFMPYAFQVFYFRQRPASPGEKDRQVRVKKTGHDRVKKTSLFLFP